jgi:N-hydroxyarylamine O-acetyltransferase
MFMHRLPEWALSYLQRLQLEPKTADLSVLRELCRAHMQVFPYENVSKLHFSQGSQPYLVPTPEVYIANAIRYDYGGTCFANNGSLLALLRNLGYRAHLVPLSEAHTAILVWGLLDNDEPVYVDMGAAAPFFEPVRFITDTVQAATAFGSESVRIVPDAVQPNRYRFLRMRRGELVSDKWNFDPSEAKELPDFSEAIESTFQPTATFMKCLRIHHYQLERKRRLSLLNNSFQIMDENGAEQIVLLRSIDELEAVVAEEFGLSRMPVREATSILLQYGVDVFAPEPEKAPS